MSKERNLQFESQKLLSYPTNNTFGFFESLGDVEFLIEDLHKHKFADEDINLLKGMRGIDKIDLSGDRHSVFEKMIRVSQQFWKVGDWKFFEKADDELRQGHCLVSVFTADEHGKDTISNLMKKHHGHDITYFNSMYVENIEQ